MNGADCTVNSIASGDTTAVRETKAHQLASLSKF